MLMMVLAALLMLPHSVIAGRLSHASEPSLAASPASPSLADPDSMPYAIYFPITSGPPNAERYPPTSRAFELELLALINSERDSAGLLALVEHPALTQAARRHAIDMARHDLNSHIGSDGSTPQARMAEQGYDGIPWTEAIVLGRSSPSDTLASWMQSPGHRDIVLDRTATEVGVGYGAGGSYGNAWVIDLGARR
jgi:uncharacterized protein YkwD